MPRKHVAESTWIASHRWNASRPRKSIAGTERARERARKAIRKRWEKYHAKKLKEAVAALKEPERLPQPEPRVETADPQSNAPINDPGAERERLMNEIFFQ